MCEFTKLQTLKCNISIDCVESRITILLCANPCLVLYANCFKTHKINLVFIRRFRFQIDAFRSIKIYNIAMNITRTQQLHLDSLRCKKNHKIFKNKVQFPNSLIFNIWLMLLELKWKRLRLMLVLDMNISIAVM